MTRKRYCPAPGSVSTSIGGRAHSGDLKLSRIGTNFSLRKSSVPRARLGGSMRSRAIVATGAYARDGGKYSDCRTQSVISQNFHQSSSISKVSAELGTWNLMAEPMIANRKR